MSRTRVMVAGRPQWQDDGPAYARRQGFGGAAAGHYQTTFTRPKRAAAGTVDPLAAASPRRRPAARRRAEAGVPGEGEGVVTLHCGDCLEVMAGMPADELRPRENGCICDVCAEAGTECRDVALVGEDQCAACRCGVHWAAR